MNHSIYKKKLFYVKNWAKTFTHAYDLPFECKISILHYNSINIYTANKFPVSDVLEKTTGISLCLFDPISYDDLVNESKDPSVISIYLTFEIGKYTIQFNAIPTSLECIECVYKSNDELDLEIRMLQELTIS